MDSTVEKYLKDKYGENYDQDAQSAYDQGKQKAATGNFFSDVGDVIAGNKIGSGDQFFQNSAKKAKEDSLGKITEDRDKYVKNIVDSGNIRKTERENALSDAGSKESQTFRKIIESKFPDVVKAYGDSWNDVSAQDQDSIFKPLQLKEQVEARKEAARLSAGNQREARAQREDDKQAKLDEKMQGLQTPFGLASTIDDAKQLKEAYIGKKNFDQKLDELIKLRTDFGGEMMNRDAVAVAQSLSKDLLLEYKNLAKLGVLSTSDEAILNKIIPSDPLEFRSPLAAIQGQDPLLKNMKEFKARSDFDYQNKIAARTRKGLKEMAGRGGEAAPKTVKVTNGKETLEIPIEDLADAKNDGFEQVSNTAGR